MYLLPTHLLLTYYWPTTDLLPTHFDLLHPRASKLKTLKASLILGAWHSCTIGLVLQLNVLCLQSFSVSKHPCHPCQMILEYEPSKYKVRTTPNLSSLKPNKRLLLYGLDRCESWYLEKLFPESSKWIFSWDTAVFTFSCLIHCR